jgi:hypothetical protein
MTIAQKPKAELSLAELSSLLENATSAPWRIDRSFGGLGGSLWITASEREGWGMRSRKETDGPICSVSTENHRHDEDRDHFGNFKGFSRSWKEPIKKAETDAKLIVAAVNALPELLRRLDYDGSETAWLIEWPSDKYGPIRYWAAGEPKPVIDPNLATRFARRADAVAVMGAYAEKGAAVAEHMWIAPKPKQRAASGTPTRRAETTGSVSEADGGPAPKGDAQP